MKMKILKNFLVSLFFVFIIISCNKRVNNNTTNPTPPDRISIPKFGDTSTFEIACWNIENFGNPAYHDDVQLQITDVVEIIKDLDIDLYAVEEIGSQSAFNSLIGQLSNYNGYLATFSGNQRTGIIYNDSLITIIGDSLLFENDSYDFPRPPLMLFLKAQRGSQIFDFHLIVIHLKAYGDQESESRRRAAIQKMEQFIDMRLQQTGDPDYIIAGDWNDELDDAPSDNVFLPFLNKQPQHYLFLTWPFRGIDYSYIPSNYRSLIDHILVTSSIDTIYNNETQIIKVDQFFGQYLAEVSDHRPVASKFFVF
jgi:predicted extracellular nuclease